MLQSCHPIGNGYVLPAGPLREDLSAIKKTDIVVINGDKNKDFEEKLVKINNKVSIIVQNIYRKILMTLKKKIICIC